MTKFADVTVGAQLPPVSYPATRLSLVKYCGASGDFNVIHWNERVAVEVGLPNVIAHGMLTMADAIRVVTDWVQDPAALVSYGVRFTRPVIVPDDGIGAMIDVSATVTAKSDDRTVTVSIVTTVGGQTVLAKAIAVVRLA